MIDLINRIESIGVAREKLRLLIQMDVFGSLSKHDPEWDSEYGREADLLHTARYNFIMIKDILDDISCLLSPLETGK